MSSPPLQPESDRPWLADVAWRAAAGQSTLNCQELFAQATHWQTIKSGSHRHVYRCDTAAGPVVLKHDHPGGRLAWLANLLRGTAALREWRKAEELARRGVATIAPLAMGVPRAGWATGDSYFASRQLTEVAALDDWFDAHPAAEAANRTMRRDVVRAVAQLLARAHAAGVEHGDLHLGNLLVRHNPAQRELRLWLIDVLAIQFRAELDWPRTRANLAMLLAGAWERLTSRERLRAWAAYRHARTERRLPRTRSAIAELTQDAWRHVLAIYRARDKRAWATNRDFRAGTSGRARLNQVSAVDEASARTAAEHWAALCRQVPAPRELRGECELTLDGLPTRCEFVLRRVGRRRGRSSAPARDWHVGQRLWSRGIDAPRPMLLWRERIAGRRFEAIAWPARQRMNLQAWLAESGAAPPSQGHRVATALGRLVGRMHAWCLPFPQPAWTDFVLDAEGQPMALRLARLDRVGPIGHREGGWRFRELAAWRELADGESAVGRTARARFLRAYLAEQRIPVPAWREVWRALAGGAISARSPG